MATENKTQPTNESVTAFLDRAEPARRVEEGHALDALFREATGEEPQMWGPSIVGYGTYHYRSPVNKRTEGEWMKTGFSPRKAKLSLYGLKDLPEAQPLLVNLGKYTEGAGCIYVNKLADIDLGVLRELIQIAARRPDDPEPA